MFLVIGGVVIVGFSLAVISRMMRPPKPPQGYVSLGFMLALQGMLSLLAIGIAAIVMGLFWPIK